MHECRYICKFRIILLLWRKKESSWSQVHYVHTYVLTYIRLYTSRHVIRAWFISIFNKIRFLLLLIIWFSGVSTLCFIHIKRMHIYTYMQARLSVHMYVYACILMYRNWNKYFVHTYIHTNNYGNKPYYILIPIPVSISLCHSFKQQQIMNIYMSMYACANSSKHAHVFVFFYYKFTHVHFCQHLITDFFFFFFYWHMYSKIYRTKK